VTNVYQEILTCEEKLDSRRKTSLWWGGHGAKPGYQHGFKGQWGLAHWQRGGIVLWGTPRSSPGSAYVYKKILKNSNPIVREIDFIQEILSLRSM